MNEQDFKFNYFPESWYPVLLSTELKVDEIKTLKAFAGELILFRGEDSRVGAMLPVCPHMGTHMKSGKISGNHLICPLHHRRYGYDGKCKKVPGSNEIPENAHSISLPVHEEVGIVFVFLGREASFPFPEFRRAGSQKAYSRPASYDLNTPYQSVLFNGFDTHHLECIHSRRILTEPVFKHDKFILTAEYSMGVVVNSFYDWLVKILSTEKNDVHLECYGGNVLIITNDKTKDNILITSYPVNYKQSRIFLTSVTEKKSDFSFGQWLRLKITTWMGVRFLRPDILIIDDMRPHVRNFFPHQDKGATVFWNYWDQLPRDADLQDLIRS